MCNWILGSWNQWNRSWHAEINHWWCFPVNAGPALGNAQTAALRRLWAILFPAEWCGGKYMWILKIYLIREVIKMREGLICRHFLWIKKAAHWALVSDTADHSLVAWLSQSFGKCGAQLWEPVQAFLSCCLYCQKQISWWLLEASMTNSGLQLLGERNCKSIKVKRSGVPSHIYLAMIFIPF